MDMVIELSVYALLKCKAASKFVRVGAENIGNCGNIIRKKMIRSLATEQLEKPVDTEDAVAVRHAEHESHEALIGENISLKGKLRKAKHLQRDSECVDLGRIPAHGRLPGKLCLTSFFLAGEPRECLLSALA